MSKRKIYYFSVGIFYLFFLPAFIYAQTSTPTPENSTTNSENTQVETQAPVAVEKTENQFIHIGDLIDVDVVGSTEYDWRGRLNPEGFLSGIGFIEEPIYGLCRTEEEAAADVAKGLSKILRDPQVIVKIIDRSGRPVSLLYGAVKTPQRFRIQRTVRLNELLILSGGITEKASGEIQIFRPQNLNCQSKNSESANQQANASTQQEVFIAAKQKDDTQNIKIKIADLIKGSPEANPLIVSGDIVTVLEADPIYVIGGVVNPKQINSHSEITVSRAIATAGGFTKDADAKNITIFRRDKTGTKIIDVDLQKIKTIPETDIVLQAFDIVDVPQTGRGKRKYPPVVNGSESRSERNDNPPLRIID